MCGRYSFSTVPAQDSVVLPDGQTYESLIPSYNLAPTQNCWVQIANQEGKYHLFRWGLIPHWAKDPEIGSKLINARCETLEEKPSFRESFRSRRCLVPADSFYEWKKLNKNSKQPYRIKLIKEPYFFFAGIFDSWLSPDQKVVKSFSILTTEPNEVVKDIHNRMPVIIDKSQKDLWLNPKSDPTSLKALFEPFPASKMHAYPVGNAVGNVGNNHPDLHKPTDVQGSLF